MVSTGTVYRSMHLPAAGPEGGNDMLSKEDSRRLALLERQLRREDPDFCARMAGGTADRKRVPISLVMAAAVTWATALILAVAGWWIAAAIAALWATMIICALAYRWRPSRRPIGPSEPDPALAQLVGVAPPLVRTQL